MAALLLWQTTRDMNKHDKLIDVWFQVCIPLIENAHISSSTVFHTSLPPHLSEHEHVSMLTVNPHRHPSSLSHSLPHCISLLAQFARAYFIPTIQRWNSDTQKQRGELHVSFVISSDSDIEQHWPHAELWNCNCFCSESKLSVIMCHWIPGKQSSRNNLRDVDS